MRTMSKEKFAEITGATGKTLDELYIEYLEDTFDYSDDEEDIAEENEAYLYSVFDSEEEIDEYFFGHDTKD